MKNWHRLLAVICAGCMLCIGAWAEESVFTQEMVEDSLVSVGNTERLHRAMEKGKNGEAVTIAYLGGSITEGASAVPQKKNCYAALSAGEFADVYMADPEKLHYINAGISGTPSLLGVTRLQNDVLRHSPDIVFVEFAVNDGTDLFSKQAYESLIRNLLNADCQPAVILIFTVTNSGYSAQAHMERVGKHYGLGMISVRDALKPRLASKEIAWKDYSADFAHPTTKGHRFMADLIAHYFAQAVKADPVPWQMPQLVCFGNQLEGLKNIGPDHPFMLSEGDFSYIVSRCYSYLRGWVHPVHKADNTPLTMEVNARRMTIVFKQENNKDCGKAEVWVDGVKQLTLSGYADNAWGNPVPQLLTLGGEGPHRVEIKMAPGDEKKRFTLLDFGYVE